MITERLPLSIGAAPAQRVLGAVFGLLFALAGAAFLLLPFAVDGWLQHTFGADESCPSPSEIGGIPPELLPPEVRECVSNGSWFTGGGFGPMRFLGLLGIPFVLVGISIALASLRTAAWIEGTRVTVRGAWRTRTVDLATAPVTAGSLGRRPTLIAQGVTIPLHGVNTPRLPAAELRALAWTIAANPAADAQNMAAQLRTMADQPLGVPAR